MNTGLLYTHATGTCVSSDSRSRIANTAFSSPWGSLLLHDLGRRRHKSTYSNTHVIGYKIAIGVLCNTNYRF